MAKTWTVQEREVYAYFARCYAPDGTTRNVSDCIVINGETPKLPPTWHLAYLHIREFFPDATPNEQYIDNPPTWGKAVAWASVACSTVT